MNATFGEPQPAFTEPKPRMTEAQLLKLWDLCGRYNVPFREDDYYLNTGTWMTGFVEGWIGGYYHGHHNSSSNDGKPENKLTIYIAVEPNGDSHS